MLSLICGEGINNDDNNDYGMVIHIQLRGLKMETSIHVAQG